MRSFRAAIIGTGPRADWHAKAYQYVPQGELVACANRGDERREVFSKAHHLRSYSDAADMIQAEQPDLVHLVTGPETRVDLMTLISDAEVPACIVEKPIACQVSDWRKLVALQKSTKTKFAVCHQFRWHEQLARCRESIASGLLGSLNHLDFSAGMNISGQGTHLLDYAMSLNDDNPVTRVFGAACGYESMTGYHPGPDATIGQLLFANGVYGSWGNGYTAPIVGDPNTNWQHVRLAAYCEQGLAYWEEFGKWRILSPVGNDSGRIENMGQWELSNHRAQAAMINAMFDWILDDAKPAGTHLGLALHQWQVVLGLYASAIWHRPVDIPFNPPDNLLSQLDSMLRDARLSG